MNRKLIWLGLAAVAALANAQGTTADPSLDKQQARALLEQRQSEVRELSAGAREVSRKIGELAIKGDVATDKGALDELKKLVAELQEINERLAKVEDAVAGIHDWIDARPTAPKAEDEDAKKLKLSNYLQFQYRDSGEEGKEQSSFNLRRLRMGFGYQADARTSAKVSFDLATGSSQTAAELKDAYITYVASEGAGGPTEFRAGQFDLPMGYEIGRSSSQREFPERSKYNRTLWDGERVRGVQVKHGVGDHTSLVAGLINSLSVKDKESAFASPDGGAQSGYVGVRYETNRTTAGIGYLRGDRPAFTGGGGTSPKVDDRYYLYADVQHNGLLDPNVFVRAEAMVGKDRVPSATGSAGRTANKLGGYHLLVGYNVNARNQIFARYGTFDPDRDTDGDLFKEYGLGYRYFINAATMVTLTHEVMEDPSLSTTRYNVTTLRCQFKF
ncbi:MAG: porin [Fimbriimonadaceae bacterium]|nr:porin [Fimbriimonadaceae bacterium]